MKRFDHCDTYDVRTQDSLRYGDLRKVAISILNDPFEQYVTISKKNQLFFPAKLTRLYGLEDYYHFSLFYDGITFRLGIKFFKTKSKERKTRRINIWNNKQRLLSLTNFIREYNIAHSGLASYLMKYELDVEGGPHDSNPELFDNNEMFMIYIAQKIS